MRYFVKLAYDGTNYKGWQTQPNGITIQEVLENAFSTILRQPIALTGAGRTDTGVHARNYYAHFQFDKLFKPEELDKLTFKLNSFLPNDITILSIFKVADDIHARFSAISRTYKYYITQNRNPFLRNYSWNRHGVLNIDLMNFAANELMKINDFTSFSKLHSQTKTNLCNVTFALWDKTPDGLVFTITSDRFLRNMVRAVVGTLVDVGKNKISHDDFLNIINSKNRCDAGESAPACGLFLDEISYNFNANK